jgi:hypothetical protein
MFFFPVSASTNQRKKLLKVAHPRAPILSNVKKQLLKYRGYG